MYIYIYLWKSDRSIIFNFPFGILGRFLAVWTSHVATQSWVGIVYPKTPWIFSFPFLCVQGFVLRVNPLKFNSPTQQMVGFGRFFCAGGKVENDGELFKQIFQVVGYNPGSNPSIRQLTQEATVVEVGSFKGSPGNSINALKGLLGSLKAWRLGVEKSNLP